MTNEIIEIHNQIKELQKQIAILANHAAKEWIRNRVPAKYVMKIEDVPECWRNQDQGGN